MSSPFEIPVLLQINQFQLVLPRIPGALVLVGTFARLSKRLPTNPLYTLTFSSPILKVSTPYKVTVSRLPAYSSPTTRSTVKIFRNEFCIDETFTRRAGSFTSRRYCELIERLKNKHTNYRNIRIAPPSRPSTGKVRRF